MTREQIIEKVLEEKVIVILRGLQTEQLVKTVAAMEKGGIRLVEVTFDQSGKTTDEQTAENIRVLSETFEGKVLVGDGDRGSKRAPLGRGFPQAFPHV